MVVCGHQCGGIALYALALIHLIGAEKNWAGWLLIIIIPLGWVLKSALIVFNPKGREAVSNLAGDCNWRQVALARPPIALLLTVLAYFA